MHHLVHTLYKVGKALYLLHPGIGLFQVGGQVIHGLQDLRFRKGARLFAGDDDLEKLRSGKLLPQKLVGLPYRGAFLEVLDHRVVLDHLRHSKKAHPYNDNRQEDDPDMAGAKKVVEGHQHFVLGPFFLSVFSRRVGSVPVAHCRVFAAHEQHRGDKQHRHRHCGQNAKGGEDAEVAHGNDLAGGEGAETNDRRETGQQDRLPHLPEGCKNDLAMLLAALYRPTAAQLFIVVADDVYAVGAAYRHHQHRDHRSHHR